MAIAEPKCARSRRANMGVKEISGTSMSAVLPRLTVSRIADLDPRHLLARLEQAALQVRALGAEHVELVGRRARGLGFAASPLPQAVVEGIDGAAVIGEPTGERGVAGVAVEEPHAMALRGRVGDGVGGLKPRLDLGQTGRQDRAALFSRGTADLGRTRSTTVIGASHNFQEVRGLHANVGSFFSADDVTSRRRVAVIGRTVVRELFGDENPLGRRIDIDGTKFRVIGIMEPQQPTLAREFCDALRSVKPDAPVELRYSSTHYGTIRVATIFDLGPEHDRLYVHCREESGGGR